MKIHFLGTAASEGIPNPFCRCEHCQQARIRKGKDLRTHSSAIIDDELLIDVAPEFSQQLLRDGLDATEIRSLLFTHTHPDHFNVGDFLAGWKGTDLRLLIRCTFLVMTVQLTVPPKCYRATALKDLLFIVWFPS